MQKLKILTYLQKLLPYLYIVFFICLFCGKFRAEQASVKACYWFLHWQ